MRRSIDATARFFCTEASRIGGCWQIMLLAVLALLLAPAQAVGSEGQVPETTIVRNPEADASISAATPAANYGSEDTLEVVWLDDAPEAPGRALLRFDLTDVPPEAIIDAAYLDLYVSYAGISEAVPLTVTNVLTDWVESVATWDTRPQTDDWGVVSTVEPVTDWQSLEVTALVQARHNTHHYGLELSGPEGLLNYHLAFASRESTDPPTLEVTYHLPLPAYTFTGTVYQGNPPDTGTPLGDARVELYGDQDGSPSNSPGAWLAGAASDGAGAFSLNWQGEPFPFYHLVQIGPPGTYPTGAQAGPSSTVTAANAVTYEDPPGGTYGDVAFWDQPLPDDCQAWLSNGDFERGSLAPWGSDGAAGLGTGRQDDYGVQFGGENDVMGEIWQVVSLPAGANPLWLSFWWLADVEEDQPGDALKVLVQYGEQGDLLLPLPAVGDLGAWRYGAVDLSPYAGQEVAVTFHAHTDGEVPTTFRLDDVSLAVCGVPPSDLVVTDLMWDEEGGICYQIRNMGEGMAPAGHQTALWIDGAHVAGEWVDWGLESGERRSSCFDYVWACSPWDDQVMAWADYGEWVAEADEANNRREETWLCDATPPEILSGPDVPEVTSSSARITWETDEDSDSEVGYGNVAGRYTYTITHSLVQAHSVSLLDLDPSTVYRFVVRSTDASGNTVESEEWTFQTLPAADDQDPSVSLLDPGACEGTVEIVAEASDNRGVAKVEFYLDGALLLTDYASPYTLVLDTTRYANGNHRLTARAYDLSGNAASDERTVEFANRIDQTVPVVTITAPNQGATVTGQITITAVVTDDRGLADVVFTVDGGQIGFQPFPSNTLTATAHFLWDTTQVSNGSHRIGAKVYDLEGKTGLATVDVDVYHPPPPPQPKLVVTAHTATRKGHYFTINLTVKNVGAATATDIYIQDYMRAFQPISRTTTTPVQATYQPRYSPANKAADCGITDATNLAQGASRTYSYTAVPIMVYPSPPTPSIGYSTKVWYKGTDGTAHYQEFTIKVLQTTGGEAIPTAYSQAIKLTDYLIVTHPQRLFSNNMWYHVDPLLSTMAQLAVHKSGVLGYLATYNKNTLDALVEPSGAWAKKMHANFSKTLVGALLIVGETEIVPAWEQGGFSIGWNPVKYSDQPYADTGGTPAPELLVGRIVGDKATTLIKPIQASIGVYTKASGYAFGHDEATLISGPGLGAFVQGVNNIASILHGQGFLTAVVHTKDYFHISSFARAYPKGNDLAVGEVVAANAGAEIVVAGTNADKIYVYDKNGSSLGSFFVGYGGNAFDDGDQIAIANSKIVMADASADRILIYGYKDAAWTLLHNFSVSFEAFDGLGAGDVAGDAQEEIAIADQSADKVVFYDATGAKRSEEVSQVFDKNDLFAVGDILGTAKDEVVIADRSSNQFLIYSANGTLQGSRTFDKVTVKGKTLTRLEYYDYDVSQEKDVGGSALAVGQLYPYPSGQDSGKEDILLAPGRNYDHLFVDWWYPSQSKLRGATPIPWSFDEYEGLAAGDVGTYLGRAQDEVFVADASGYVRILDTNNWLNRFHTALPTYTRDADVVYLSGHGNVSGCCGMSSYAHSIFPLDFNQHNPVFMVTSCLTGNYEDGNDTKNFAESILHSGAAAYIGATKSSHGGEDRAAANWLYGNWNLGESIGKVFTELERSFWKGSPTDYWWFWVYEYNLYGDPRFGAPPSTGLQALVDPPLPSATLQIQVPHYVVTTTHGLDWVEIPGGRLPTEPGELWLPTYQTSIDYPQGIQVQDVGLITRTGLITDTGLILPMTPETLTPCACTPVPYSGTADGWLPEEVYAWDVIHNTDGTNTLTVVVYPFYYNPQTTDVQFFQDYTFEVATTTSVVRITDLATEKHEYQPGEQVGIDVALENLGEEAQDVVVSALVQRYGSEETVDGLPLQAIDDLLEQASFSTQWDSSGLDAGYYAVQVTVKDTAEKVLDRATEMFRLGIPSGEITHFAATPAQFDVGEVIDVSMGFRNTGSITLNGSAVIRILDEAGEEVKAFRQDVVDLPPDQSLGVDVAWDTSGAGEGTYRLVGYVTYDSGATDLRTAVVSTESRVYLPIVMRNK